MLNMTLCLYWASEDKDLRLTPWELFSQCGQVYSSERDVYVGAQHGEKINPTWICCQKIHRLWADTESLRTSDLDSHPGFRGLSVKMELHIRLSILTACTVELSILHQPDQFQNQQWRICSSPHLYASKPYIWDQTAQGRNRKFLQLALPLLRKENNFSTLVFTYYVWLHE